MDRTVAISGANGFLGWHTRAAALESQIQTLPISLGEGFDEKRASEIISGSDRALHIAGANRGSDEDVRDTNISLATQFKSALLRAENPPKTVVFANSTQATNGSVYGESKAFASEIIRSAADEVGSTYVDVKLPNLFGEHGRPFYNAVTATFAHLLAHGQPPTVEEDKDLTLLHAQDAADLMLGKASVIDIDRLQTNCSVTSLLGALKLLSATYDRGEVPDIATKFRRDLFNTYRSYAFEARTPIELSRHGDARGSFFEIVRAHGGTSQASFSTTAPGVSRGDHFHRRKVERFTVLSGTAVISLRRLFDSAVRTYSVSGASPEAIDMPTMWAHKITNIGDDDLLTSFWSNDIFDPTAPDTIAEAV